MVTTTAQPAVTLRQLSTAYWISQAINTVARLRIPDRLAAGPRSVVDLAADVGAQAPALGRLLRAVAGLGVLAQHDDGRFGLTALGELLRSDVPGSMWGWAVVMSEPWYRSGWDNLLESVRTGEPGFNAAHGTDFWEYLAHNQEANRLFNLAMTSGSSMRSQALLEAYDFSDARTVVDVGGGHGSVLAAILRATPGVRGVLFDRPHVVSGAAPVLASAGVAERCETVGGDFFAEVPAGGDVYVMAVIIHDWQDEPATSILAACRRAMADDARILLIEQVIPDGDGLHPSKLDDLNMLVTCRGRERSAAEFSALFAGAGLEMTRIMQTSWPWSVIEGARVPGHTG